MHIVHRYTVVSTHYGVVLTEILDDSKAYGLMTRRFASIFIKFLFIISCYIRWFYFGI